MSRSRCRPHVLPLVAVTLLLGACGSGGDGATIGARAPSTTTAPGGTTATPALPADPKGRLEAASDAMAKVRSLHVEGTSVDEKDGRSRISGDLTDDGDAAFTLRSEKQNIDFRVLGDDTFLRGDEGFWKDQGDGAHGPDLAAQLAGRWVRLPTAASGVREELDDLLPRTLAKCLRVGSGTLSDGGTAVVDGQPARVLVDAGDRPGTTPGRLYVAAEGRPLPLRLVQTGRKRPGGVRDEDCDDDDEETGTGSDARLSRFDEPVRVVAPKGALEIPTPGATGRSSS